MKKTGLIGGTFDPVHKGHVRLAFTALEFCGLEEVTFIPAALPPHKGIFNVASFQHRRKMLEIATSADEKFSVSDIESGLESPSYTYLTLRELRKKNAGGAALYFIIGSDAFLEIESWKNWREVIATTNFIIAVRPGSSLEELQMFLKSHGFSGLSETKWQQADSEFSIVILESEFADISSTDIRMKIERGDAWEHLLPLGVAEYIRKKKLYS